MFAHGNVCLSMVGAYSGLGEGVPILDGGGVPTLDGRRGTYHGRGDTYPGRRCLLDWMGYPPGQFGQVMLRAVRLLRLPAWGLSCSLYFLNKRWETFVVAGRERAWVRVEAGTTACVPQGCSVRPAGVWTHAPTSRANTRAAVSLTMWRDPISPPSGASAHQVWLQDNPILVQAVSVVKIATIVSPYFTQLNADFTNN